MNWYKRYPQPWLSGTATFTLEERGAYQVLLDYQWDMGGRLPAGERDLAQLLGVSVRKFRALWKRKLGEKFLQDDHGYYNRRLDDERLSAIALSEKRREAGKQGGKAKAIASHLVKQMSSKTPSRGGDTRGSRETRVSTSRLLASDGSEEGERERGSGDPAVLEVLGAYNSAFVTTFMPAESTTGYLAERLGEGRTPAECIAVIRHWKDQGRRPRSPQQVFAANSFGLALEKMRGEKAPEEGIIPNVSPGGQGSPLSRCGEKGCSWIGTTAEYGPHMKEKHPALGTSKPVPKPRAVPAATGGEL